MIEADRGPEGAGRAAANLATGIKTIAVDLDWTLLKHDTLHEQVVRMAFMPRLLPGLLLSLAKGKAAAKSYCADHIVLDMESLHACEEVLEFLGEERANGSHIVLCTAADRRVAQAVVDFIGLFDEVIATQDNLNLKGASKAKALQERFPQGFIYAGDHEADLSVWAASEGIVLVGAKPGTVRKARLLGKPIIAELRLLDSVGVSPRVWIKSMRVHHWSKNLLMFVPLVLAHSWFSIPIVVSTILGFLLLLAVTSASYFINDLADIDADRQHATKRNRPIASGALPLMHALAFPLVVIPVALVLAVLLNPWFALGLASYLVITLSYSFGLKRIPLLDTLVIGVLFTTRLLMGVAFVGTALPIWLVTFSMFFFFSLAMAKRHAEIVRAATVGGASLASRGYQVEDAPLTLTLGVGTALASLVILVLYMVDEAFRVVGYSRPEFLWVITLFLSVWVGRVWLLTHRGSMNDDPVSFALRDRPSRALALAIGACFLIAL